MIGDAIYRKWFVVPNTSQVLVLVFEKACAEPQRPTPSIER